jgi:predicted small secreted protein
MFKRARILALTVIALAGAMPVLSGCHATAGLGEDVSKTGQAVSKAADGTTPKSP